MFEGGSSGDQLGRSLAAIGDLDGDGAGDILLGAPQYDFDAPEQSGPGYVEVRSSASGAPIRSLTGDRTADGFGFSVASAGDLDGDGFPEVLVGAPQPSGNGYARVYSGRFLATGQGPPVMFAMTGRAQGDAFGSLVRGAGDLDGDGSPDFVVGAPLADEGGLQDAGSLSCYSGASGKLLRRLRGQAAEDYFGKAAAGLGDLTGDGYGELLVSAPAADDPGMTAGRVEVYSGRSLVDGVLPRVLWSRTGTLEREAFGYSVASAGDVDADGLSDFIVGALGERTGGRLAGAAFVFSGRLDGTRLLAFYGSAIGESLGHAVDSAGDLDADGHGDLLVGAEHASGGGERAGRLDVYSGRTGERLIAIDGAAGDWLGHDVAGLADVNGDGVPDLLVSAFRRDTTGTDNGAAEVYSGCLGSREPYGAGTPGSGGLIPSLKGRGCPRQGATIRLEVLDGLGGATGLLVLGTGRASIPVSGCTLLVALPAWTLPITLGGAPGVPGAGSLELIEVLPVGPAWHGRRIDAQAFVLDAGAPRGLSATAALELEID
ncbi:MAG: FG-GAP-like repeat-containing protein [Planctomycetota bacterium]